MLESVLLAQEKQDERIKLVTSKVDILTTHNKMLESQISQPDISSLAPQGRLSSEPVPNPREHCNCIVLRSGKQLDSPKGAKIGVDGGKNHDVHVDALPNEDKPQKKSESEKPIESKPSSPKPYMPPLPFP